MSVSVVKRPEGPKLSTTGLACQVTAATPVDVTVLAGHGLTTGDIVYLSVGNSLYNGYWYVFVTTPQLFNIREYPTASFLNGSADALGLMYAPLISHRWNCVHLPIIYKLSTNLWPTNSVDTSRTISSTTSDANFTKITASGDIKATGQAQELEWVQLVGGTDINGNTLSGIYQIINFVSDTVFTIDLPYSSGNSFGGASIQYYYMNYHIRIRVFAGNSFWNGSDVPGDLDIEQVCEIKVIPDSLGIIKVSLNEFIKKKIQILSNDPSIFSSPQNVNAFCNFYITFAESYDKSSSGYTLGTFVSSYTDDSGTFTGVATNTKLPFKNLYGGLLSYYLYATSASAGNFLTNFSIPSIFPSNYYDISFIFNEAMGAISFMRLFQERYRNGAIQGTTVTTIGVNSTANGIYRTQISAIGNEDKQIIYLKLGATNTLAINPITININTDCSSQSINLCWLNNLGGFDYWVFTAQQQHGTNILGTGQATRDIFLNWPNSYGLDADTIQYETFRDSVPTLLVTSQYVKQEELQVIENIKKSPLVQIIVSATDRRTVIVDTDSFISFEDNDKTFSISFTLTYTDNNPSQSI